MDGIIYLIEVSLVLTGMFLIYWLLLRYATFFDLNRYYLLSILVVAMFIPLIPFDAISIEVVPNEVTKATIEFQQIYVNWLEPTIADKKASIPVWLYLIGAGYALGVVFCYVRFAYMLKSIHGLIQKGSVTYEKEFKLVEIESVEQPFSFLTYVFANKQLIEDSSFDKILDHEKVHINQRHSIDLIFVQLIAPFLWFHPLVWRLVKSIKTNHEYIVDHQIIKEGYSLVEYQTLLLSQLVSNNSYGLVHNFNFSFIKKRITMMNTNKKSLWAYAKVTLAILSTALFTVACVHGFGEHAEQFKPDLEVDVNIKNRVEIYFDGNEPVGGLELSTLTKSEFNNLFSYEFLGDDYEHRDEYGNVELVLVRDGRAVVKITEDAAKKSTISTKKIFDNARPGDRLVVVFNEGQEVSPQIFSIPLK